MIYLAYILTIFCIVSIANNIASITTLKLPTYHKIFDRKPFSCRKCSTFWISTLLNILIGIIVYDMSYKYFTLALLVQFTYFFIQNKNEKKHIVE